MQHSAKPGISGKDRYKGIALCKSPGYPAGGGFPASWGSTGINSCLSLSKMSHDIEKGLFPVLAYLGFLHFLLK